MWLLPGYEALSDVFTLTGSKKPAGRQADTDKHSSNGRFRSLGLKFGQSSMQGWRDRMEDASVSVQLKNTSPPGNHLVHQQWDNAALFGVFDGHGGAQVAKFCARHLPTEMAAAGGRGRTVVEALHECFHGLDRLLQNPKCSQELLSLAHDDTKCGESAHSCGCTVAACCVLQGGEVVVANAGDCRVVLSRQGCAMNLSQDHKPTLAGEMARIRNAGGRIVDKVKKNDGARPVSRIVGHGMKTGGLNVSRTIGDLKYKQNENLPPNSQMVCCTPEIMSFFRVPQDEFLIIACDGIWDVLTSQQVVDGVRRHLPAMREGTMKPAEVAEEILDMCVSPNLSLTHGLGGDNMTLMIILFADQMLPGEARNSHHF